MIKLVRLDERLIHGQIAIKWSRLTGVNRIVVANDDAAGSDIIQKSLMMAAPSDVKTLIKSVDDSIRILDNPKAADLKVLLLVKTPEDMLKVLDGVPGIEKANIGNYGRVEAKHEGYDRKTFGNNLYADELEIPLFQKIAEKCKEMGIECIYQTTPEEPAEPLAKLVG